MHTDSYITMAGEDALMGIALGFVLLRLYVRCWLQNKFDSADAFVICAWLCFFTNCIIDRTTWRRDGLEIVWNAGVVGATVPDFQKVFQNDDLARRALKVVYVNFVPYLCTLFFVKFAFLRLYYDLIPASMGRLRVALHFITAFTVTSFVALVGLNMFWCYPLSKNWEVVKSKACYSVFELTPWFISAAVHVITDIAIYALPFFLLPALRVSRRVNRTSLLGVTLMFSLGGVCIGITLARVITTGMNADISSVAMFQAAEYASGIIVACCPPLKWLWMSLRKYGVRARKGSFAAVQETRETKFKRAIAFAGMMTRGKKETTASSAANAGETTITTQGDDDTKDEKSRKRNTMSILMTNHEHGGPNLIV